MNRPADRPEAPPEPPSATSSATATAAPPAEPVPAPAPEPRRFAKEAYLFVFEALQQVQDDLAADPRPPGAGNRAATRAAARDGRIGRHITAAELCEGFRTLAAAQFGGMARTVLNQWGLRDTEDVGRVVFELVERGELCKCDGDRQEDFAGLFDFDAVFDQAFDAALDSVALAPAR